MGYQLADFKWGGSGLGSGSGAVSVSANLSGIKYDQNRFEEEDFTIALNKAFNAWENVSGVTFASGARNANIEVDVESLPGSTIGLASISYSNRSGVDRINSADITFDEDETWAPNGEGGAQNFYAVALHEIGHAFGLGHINDRSQIMNPVISADDLGDGDIDGAQALYGKDPGDQDSAPDFDSLDENGPISMENEQEPEAPEGDPNKNIDVDDGDDGGGIVAALLGGLVALIMGFLGVGGAVAGAAFMALRPGGETEDPIEVPPYEGTGTTLADVLPTYECVDHAAGCGCGCQHSVEEDEDGNFEITHQLFA